MGAFLKPTDGRILAALTLLALAIPPAAAAEDVRALVLRSFREGGQIPLTGEQVTAVDGPAGRREAVQVIKRRPGHLRIEYLSPPAVRGQVMVDDGRVYRLYKPLQRVIEEGPSRLAPNRQQFSRQISLILKGKVDIREEREETIAGRPTRVVLVTPLPAGRWRRLWLDRELAVPLKIEEQGSGPQKITTYFTRVDFASVPSENDFVLSVPPGTAVIPAGLGRPVPLAQAQKVAEAWGGLLEPAALPPGFGFRAAFVTRLRQSTVVALHYSDGQQPLTIFQGTQGGQPTGRKVGGLSVVTRAVNGVTVTAVGRLPEADLARVLESLAR